MKTIEVSDEIYESLMNISKEMTTQDNRCTAMPYFFQVRETKEIPAHDGSGDQVWYNHDCELEVRTRDEKIEWLCEDADSMSGHLKSKEEIKEQFENLDDYDIDSLLEEKGFCKYNVQEHFEYSNAFFTSKACDEHIRINRHNLTNPVNYLSHAFRNPEMELISKFLCELSGGKMHK